MKVLNDVRTVTDVFLCVPQGKVECWDPRTRNRVGVLDCALSSVTADKEYGMFLFGLFALNNVNKHCLYNAFYQML